jgi:hypothetical protein
VQQCDGMRGGCWDLCQVHLQLTCLLLGTLARTRTFHTITALDNIGLEAYRARAAMQLEEEATSIAKHGSDLIASPQRSGRGRAVLAGGL